LVDSLATDFRRAPKKTGRWLGSPLSPSRRPLAFELLRAGESGLYQKQEARIAWTIPASLSDQDLDIAAMPGGARQYWSWLNIDPKVLRTLRPRGAILTDRIYAPSNGFRAAVYDSIGPLLPLMTVNSGTRWLPEPETFGSRSGRGCRPKVQTGHQPRSFGQRPNGAQVR